MVRPREFDQSDVLDRALAVFWRRGYDGTSIADLVEATGLQRQSLYNAFTDKNGLFRASLDWYRVKLTESLVPLERAGAGLDDLRSYMESVIELQRKGGFGACLLVKTAFGPESADPQVRAAVQSGAGAVRARFARVVEGAIARGEADPSQSPESCASFLYTVLNGLSALVRTGDGAHAADVLARTFESLRFPPARRPKKTRTRSRP